MGEVYDRMIDVRDPFALVYANAPVMRPLREEINVMCRNIRTLANFEPPATEQEIRASALQFVRKVSGTNKPSRANEAAFNQALEEVTAAATRLVRSFTTSAAPRNRDEEIRKAKARAEKRYA